MTAASHDKVARNELSANSQLPNPPWAAAQRAVSSRSACRWREAREMAMRQRGVSQRSALRQDGRADATPVSCSSAPQTTSA